MHRFIGGLAVGLVTGAVLTAAVADSERGRGNGIADAPAGAQRTVAAVEWKMASALPGATPQGGLAARMTATLRTASKGAVDITFFEPGALVPTRDLFEAVASGTIDAAFASPVEWDESSPALHLFGGIPFGPPPAEFLAWYRTEGAALRAAINARHGVHGIFCGVAGPAGGGWFKTPIRAVDDLNGLRIAASGLESRIYAKLGARTSRFAPADLAAAMKAGELDAAVFSTPAADRALGLQEYASYYYFPGWHRQIGLLELLINRARWDETRESERLLIRSACAANVANSLAESEASQFDALKALVIAGTDVNRWPAEVLDAVRRAWSDSIAELSVRDPEFRKLWKSLAQFEEGYSIWRELGYL